MKHLFLFPVFLIVTAFTPASGQAIQATSKAQLAAPEAERISYASARPSNWNLYYFSKRQTTPKQLTSHPDLEYNPVLSPDGQWVVYCAERQGNPDLYALDLQKGGEPYKLIDSDALEDQPVFSPDGKTLLFVSTHSGNADIYRLPFKPTETQRIGKAINLTRHPGADLRPSFSPDGQAITFSSDRDSLPSGNPTGRSRAGEIYQMSFTGKNVKRLTQAPGWDGSPVWSLNGKVIYFYSQRDGKLRIWAMNPDGSAQRPLTPDSLRVLSPSPMADGRILFTVKRGSRDKAKWQLMSILPDGSNLQPESDTLSSYWSPRHHPKTGATLCYGPAIEPLTASVGDVGAISGSGPLVIASSIGQVDLPGKSLRIYPVRNFAAAIHPYQPEILLWSPISMANLHLNNGAVSTVVKGNVYVSCWSADGQWIYYTQGDLFRPAGSQSDVWKVRADGTDAINLTPDSPGNDGFAGISADGSRLVFRSGRTGNFDIYLAKGNGSDPINLTNHPAKDAFPAIAPNGKSIVFCSNREGDKDPKTGERTYELYHLALLDDGLPGKLTRLTTSDGQDAHAQFSPDGKWIVYSSEQGGISDEEPLFKEILFAPQMYGEIYAMRLSDRKVVRLTHNKWEDGFPSWANPVGAITMGKAKKEGQD